MDSDKIAGVRGSGGKEMQVKKKYTVVSVFSPQAQIDE